MSAQSVDLVEISGTPRARGRTYGESLRGKICERDRVWREQIEAACQMPSRRFIDRFFAETRFMPAIEQWTPHLLEEVRGIAEGSALPFAAVLAGQFMDEECWYQQALTGTHHCSSLGGKAADGSGNIIGQTMDLPVWMNGFQTLLLIRDVVPGTDAYVVTVAAMIAELDDRPRVHIAAGAPSDFPFERYEFGAGAASLAAAQ